MAGINVRSSSKKRVLGGILNMKKSVLEKLQNSCLLWRSYNQSSSSSYYGDYENHYTSCVPEDVTEGHFVVIAKDINDEEINTKRFVVPLSCLNNPKFLMLLEESAEEYGFEQYGALTIPCKPSELEMLLLARQYWNKERGSSETNSWPSQELIQQNYYRG